MLISVNAPKVVKADNNLVKAFDRKFAEQRAGVLPQDKTPLEPVEIVEEEKMLYY